MMKQVARAGIAVMTTLLVLVVSWQFRIVLVYVLISLALAAALRPLVNRLVGQGFVVRVAWILLYVAALGCFTFLLFLAAGAVISEIRHFAQSVSVQDAWRLPSWLRGSSFDQALVTRLPSPSKLFEAVTGDQGQLVLPTILGLTQSVGALLGGAFVILFLSIHWSINQIHFERLWLSLLPSAQRKQARGIWRSIELEIGAYLRGEVVLSLLTGLLLGLGYWLIGSPYPTLLALVGALAILIPLVGVALAIIPMFLVGLLTSVELSLLMALYALVTLIALEVWVKPRLFNRKWDNLILTVTLLIALADAFGLAGIIVAPPLSVVCQILWSRLVSHRAASGAAALASDLKERQARLRDTIRAMDEPPPPLVTSSMERLADLIAKAEPVLHEDLPAELGEALFPPRPETTKGRPPVSTNLEETNKDHIQND